MKQEATRNSHLLIEGRALACERDSRLLFSQLDFLVSPGEIIQVEGPNGSGKTTLLNILAGLSQDFDGRIVYPALATGRLRYEEMLYLGHLSGIKSDLTPEENLHWLCRIQSGNIKKITEALAKVGLRGFEDVPAHSLSAGQKRRIALARLYLSEAKLWILDEPFTAIDKKGVAELESRIRELADSGGAVVLTTHHDLKIEGQLRRVQLGQPSLEGAL